MPDPNAVVSTLIRFERPLDRPPAELLRSQDGLMVELDGGRRVLLDPDDPRSPGYAQVLDGLSKQQLAVYLEIDPATSAITRLLIPLVTRVVAIRPATQDVLEIELELSHALHTLTRSAPDYDQLERSLRNALESGAAVTVTEDDAHEIIDIRAFTPGPEGPPPHFPKPGPPPLPRPKPWLWRWLDLLVLLWRWPWWPWWWWSWWWRCISATRAQQVFDAMGATTCNPLTVPAPCIPFLYPDDGCWARAHEMCRLMIGMGLSPRKVWIQGGLHPNTRNNPACHVGWGWHVAPTLCVRGPLIFQTQRMVIDPSLFTTPVTKAAWKAIQLDPNATLTDTDASDYLWGQTDANYALTNDRLNYYRLQLQIRALQQGPPPYANCP